MATFDLALSGVLVLALLHYGARFVAICQIYWIEWKFERHMAEWDFVRVVSKMKVAGWYHENMPFSWATIICFMWIAIFVAIGFMRATGF
jgi:hypothetical protein